ncbi:LysR family transcriptional regulator [Rhizobium sp. R72]|uniref:LysR substrate-binding domain-containing protein n=1 Tax=unclassified Rhizobium TaxID=2613769 RepID=UPI000B52BF0A|nr:MULTISPECIES: LysR substrate-binding domain-containing protein [unclassified Rhizobium]OWV93160.1 LysR family transcriptional regulator [Rhizobium sp. R72]OWV93387.1 LysR family transcriptional regulator [Rhizobium sp. R711]OWV99494.1 LysR family transcriptional regulator [Rhizobium sp. R693]
MKLSKQFPLNALRVFEAVARLGSFTKAGDELGMTQTAVSYQVKLLEENIGEPLFLRRPRQIALTDAGERLAPKVTEAFAMLHEAMASVREQIEDTLIIHSTATFAQQWLSRHIGSFQLKHPNIAVRLITSGSLVDFNREAADIAIRWGKGDWQGLTAHKIMSLDFTPMLSPALAEKAGGINTPADLLRLTLISARDPWWLQWFNAADVDNPGLEKFPKNEFGTQVLDANIAMAGQGVAILSPGHFLEDIAAGRLYQPFALTANDGRDYWLAYPETRRNVPKIKAFRNWILEEMNFTGTDDS